MSFVFRLKGDFASLEVETAMLWELGCQGIVQDNDDLLAYFEAPLELPLTGRWEQQGDRDWLAAYYAELKPVVLQRLIVAPTHCRVEARAGQSVIWLDPGMAFGTGHHATTRLALAALEQLDLRGKSVLDVGSGSGLLAIAADLLGAKTALGLDIDPATLPVANSNRELNDSKASFRLGSLDNTVPDASVDVIVANLFAELHAELAREYTRVLKPGGVLLITGILRERVAIVREALEPQLEITTIEPAEEWLLISARRPLRKE